MRSKIVSRRCRSYVVAPLVTVALLAGCASPSYVTLLENPDGRSGNQVVVQGDRGQQILDRPGMAAPLDGSKAPAPIDPEQVKRDFAAALSARPALPMRFILYFESGGAQLTTESQALVPQIVEAVRSRVAADVSIIGHTDTVGAAQANEALGRERAHSVAALLRVAGLQIRAVLIGSHGESNLLVMTPDESSEPRNRRVEVTVR